MEDINILDKIQSEIKQDYYKQHYPNDGQRFVGWYLRNIHLLDSMQAKSAKTDGAKDKQIDAVYIDDDESKIYIIQGKFYTGPADKNKDYTPYHFLFAISSIFAKINGTSNVPSPNACYKVASSNNMVDQIVAIAANCLNSAFDAESNNAQSQNKPFIPQNWVKNKSSVSGIQSAVTNYMSFLPSMNAALNKQLKENLKIDPKEFTYRLTAD